MESTFGWVSFEGVAEAFNSAKDAIAEAELNTSVSQSIHCSNQSFGIAAIGPNVDFFHRDGIALATIGHVMSSRNGKRISSEQLAERYQRSGRDCLTTIHGAFACIIVVPGSRSCLIASDRFGMVPLYYRTVAKGLIFATRLETLKSLFGHSFALDQQALYNYMFFHCIPSPRTVYRDVSKLGPATSLELVGDQVNIAPYWKPNFRSASMSNTELNNAAADLRGAFRQAVADAASQTSAGAFLSGGLDSSTVAGVLKEVDGKARTFTVGFDEAQYDESSFARTTSTHFDTDHHEVILSPSYVEDALSKISNYLDEPFGNSSVIPTYYCAVLAKENNVTSLLAGDGGDELFAGNTRYVDQNVFERYESVPGFLRHALEKGYEIAPLLKSLPLSRKGFGYISKAKMGLPDRLQAYNFLAQFSGSSIFNSSFLDTIDQDEPWTMWRDRYAEPEDATALQRMLYLDWKFTLADNDLVKVSSMCSLAGIGVRYPMLDQRVVDSSVKVDSNGLLAGGELRGYYKNAWREFLPPSIFSKSKHGFGLPFGVWMRRDPKLQQLVRRALDSMRQRDIFNPEFIDTALRMHDSDSPGYYGELVWIIMMLELWLDAHGNLSAD